MICIKCGKKIEYEMPACKYCKEPIVLEGSSPMGNISALAPKAAPCDVPTSMRYEMPMHRPAYAPKGSSVKKFIPLIVGGACAMVLLLIAIIINLPTEKNAGGPNTITKQEDIKAPSEVYDDILDKATKEIDSKLSEAEKAESDPQAESEPQAEDEPQAEGEPQTEGKPKGEAKPDEEPNTQKTEKEKLPPNISEVIPFASVKKQ